MQPESLISAIARSSEKECNRDLEIYIHIPFCSSKCHFCDWVVEVPTRQLLAGHSVRGQYVDRLCEQISFYGPQLMQIGYRPKYIYWGGGTPTRLEPDETNRIIDVLEESFDLSGLEQHTMESTPNDITPEKAANLKQRGVDRVSVGVQSFDAFQLRTAGRAHSAEQAVGAVAILRDAGIDNINIDLISGFPGEKRESFEATMDQALKLDPPHVTIYSYRATPETRMAIQVASGFRQLTTLEHMIDSYEYAQELLDRAGYREYLYNCFAREERYQFKVGLFGYGLRGDTIGFGSGASSTIGHHFLLNEKENQHLYMKNPLAFDMTLQYGPSQITILTDAIGNALMTNDGLRFDRFKRLTGCEFNEIYALPGIQGWFKYLKNCGAEFRWEQERLYLTPGTIPRIYLSHLFYSNNPEIREKRERRTETPSDSSSQTVNA